MIQLQRKLAIIIKKEVFEKGNAPKHISQGQGYAVIGYSVQTFQKTINDEQREVEEIAGFLVVNNEKRIGYIYPNLCEIYIDPFENMIVDSPFIKGQNTDGKTDKAKA